MSGHEIGWLVVTPKMCFFSREEQKLVVMLSERLWADLLVALWGDLVGAFLGDFVGHVLDSPGPATVAMQIRLWCVCVCVC